MSKHQVSVMELEVFHIWYNILVSNTNSVMSLYLCQAIYNLHSTGKKKTHIFLLFSIMLPFCSDSSAIYRTDEM